MNTFTAIVTYGKTNTFTLMFSATDNKHAVERIQRELAPGASFKLV